MRNAQLGGVAVVLAVAAALGGCSSSKDYGAIAQAASNADGPVRSVVIALAQEKSGRGLSSITNTSAEDALKKVVDADSSLASMVVTGDARTARDHVLREVRVAEDALLSLGGSLTTDRAAAIKAGPKLAKIAARLQSLEAKYDNK